MTKILLVEDDKSLREIYGVRLQAEGYDIVSAGDGEEALAMAIKEKPVLIISDVMMPKISGFDMLDILRSTTETRDIKVIMMTALSSDDQRNRGEQLGADRYLVKSQVGIEDVVRSVHEVLSDSPAGATTAAAPAPAVTSEPSPAAEPATPAAPVATEPVAVTPVEPVSAAPTPQPEPVAAPVASDPVVPTQSPSPVAGPSLDASDPVNSAAPGNDAAGPLPPQPTISSLPEPTAPFSSPRPANLGERLIQPLETPSQPTVTDEDIARELNAPVEPAVAATPVASTPEVAPIAPVIPQAPAIDLAAAGAPPTSADDVLPPSQPVDSLAPQATSVQASDDQQTPQSPTPQTPSNPAI